MRGVFNLFQKKDQFRPEPGMQLEIELPEEDLVLHARVRQVGKKTLGATTSHPLPRFLGPGAKVRVHGLSGSTFYSYGATVHNCEGTSLDLSIPGSDAEAQALPAWSDEDRVDFSVHADYQASRSPYKQAADVLAVGRQSLLIQANVSIPSQTALELWLKLPGRDLPWQATARTVRSQPATEPRKHLVEIDLSEVPEAERSALWDAAVRQHMRLASKN